MLILYLLPTLLPTDKNLTAFVLSDLSVNKSTFGLLRWENWESGIHLTFMIVRIFCVFIKNYIWRLKRNQPVGQIR